MEPHDYSLRFALDDISLGLNYNTLTHISGEIKELVTENETTVGTINAVYVDNFEHDVLIACDDHSEELGHLAALLFGEDGDWLDTVWTDIEPNGLGLLYLERVEIDDAHRGRDLGLYAAHALFREFGHGGPVAFCKPFPLRNFRTGMSEKDDQEAQFKLAAYWSRLGFRRFMVDGKWTEFLYLDLCSRRPGPPFRKANRPRKTSENTPPHSR